MGIGPAVVSAAAGICASSDSCVYWSNAAFRSGIRQQFGITDIGLESDRAVHRDRDTVNRCTDSVDEAGGRAWPAQNRLTLPDRF